MRVAHALHRPAARTLVTALLAVYLVLLVWLVVWKLRDPFDVGPLFSPADRHLKLVPFVQTPLAGASRPIEVVGNVIVFVPFGLLLGLRAPVHPVLAVAAMAGTSCVFEVAQYVLAVGVTDTSDVLANSAGGALGLALARLARPRPRYRRR